MRDRLLGREPKDFDIATSALPSAVRSLFPNTIAVGVQFGVVLVVDDGVPFEVATFRSDGRYLDGRHPETVDFGTVEADARRRDFTINGLFLDPVSGEVVDFVGGQADLRAGLVRAIGDAYERIKEDRLRMLRAVRFTSVLGFEIEKETRQAIQANAESITDVAWERIGEEIVKILRGGFAGRGFTLLDELGLLARVLPEVAALRGVEQSPDYHPEGDALTHTFLLLSQLAASDSEALVLGALLHDVAKPLCAAEREGKLTFYGHCDRGAEMAVEICKRLRRSRVVRERVAYLVKNHLRLLQAAQMRVATLKRMLRESGFAELMRLARIDALAANGDLRHVEFCAAKLAELGEEDIRPAPFLRGRDLIALGYRPGPGFAEILDALEAAQLDGEILDREAARAWVLGHFPPPADRA